MTAMEDESASQFEQATAKDHQRLLFKAMDSLSLEHKEALHLFYYEEMPTKAIASSLAVKEATIRTRLHYAKKAMQSALLALGLNPDTVFNE